MNKAILSENYPQFAERLRALGYQTIPTERVSCFLPYEQDHADMQCLILDDTAFVLSSCQKLAGALSADHHVILCETPPSGKYPDHVKLNALSIGKRLICRVSSLDSAVQSYCIGHGYETFHVNQGYTKCSCAVVSDQAVITADNGIYNSLKEINVDVLKIEQGRVKLEGVDYGFIGGASGYDKATRTLFFCGDITKHPGHERIKEFCGRYHTNVVSLSDDVLMDIGGIIFC